MIISNLKHIERYSNGLGKNFITAINKLKELTPNDYASTGRHELDGDNVYFMVNKYQTKEKDTAQYESHSVYADIQFMVSGHEKIYCAPTSFLEKDGSYLSDKDKQAYKNSPGTLSYKMSENEIAIFFPEDGHQVGCIDEEKCDVIKIVMKVKL